MRTIDHPFGGAPIKGELLKRGDSLQAGDRYASTSGTWEECPNPGLKIGETDTVWVRPA